MPGFVSPGVGLAGVRIRVKKFTVAAGDLLFSGAPRADGPAYPPGGLRPVDRRVPELEHKALVQLAVAEVVRQQGAVMTHWNVFPEGFYEALLSVVKEGYPGKEIKPLTYGELEAIDRDMQILADLQGDNPVERRTEIDAYLQEIIRVTLENSGIQFDD